MSGLTPKDIRILQHYAEHGNRELYWNYLAQLPGSEGYGLLALGVTRNDNLPGQVANGYAQNHARSQHDNGSHFPNARLSEREWDQFGQTLLVQDLARRQYWMQQEQPQRALNLPGKDVQQSHDLAFNQHKLDPDCWTPRRLLEATRLERGDAGAEQVWRTMLNNDVGGLARASGTSVDVFRNMPLLGAMGYMGRLAGHEMGAALADRDTVNPHVIGGKSIYHMYEPGDGHWYRFGPGMGFMGAPVERDAATLERLEDTRLLREERQDKATQFHPEDPYRSIARSPQVAALDPSELPGQSLPGQAPRTLAALQPGDAGDPLYQQIHSGVCAMEANQGRCFDATSERVVGALLLHARANGFERVDHVMLSEATASSGAGQLIFLVQGAPDDPTHRRSALASDVAVQGPVEQMKERLGMTPEADHAEAQALQQSAVRIV